MALVIATAPAAEPILKATAKAHVRQDSADDDTLIESLIVAARNMTENITRRALITQTWDLYLDDWPDGDTLVVPLPPLQSVTYVKYTDEDGDVSTFAATNYVVDAKNEPGRIRLTSGANWPTATLQAVNGVNVRFVAGYGAAGTSVPQAVLQAMYLMIGHWYENRELVIISGAMPKELPFATEALLWPYRVYRWV